MSPLLLGGLSRVTLPGLALAIVYALLTGLNEEAFARGLILQTVLPYGAIPAAFLSAFCFAFIHLNNLFTGLFSSIVFVFIQVLYAFCFGFALAAFRLRTRTLWPLIVLHVCIDIPVDIRLFATRATPTPMGVQSLIPYLILIALTVILACYGFFLLRPQGLKRKEATVQ